MPSKVFNSAGEALLGLYHDGMSIMAGGFGLAGTPEYLIQALVECEVRNLTLISNNCGADDHGLWCLLRNGQIRKMFASYVGDNNLFERLLGRVGLDFTVIDKEHATVSRTVTDMVLLAARAGRIDALVRVQSSRDSDILSALDCGASGVLVPHVASPETARQVVSCCRYRNGHRGLSPSGRAGGYGDAKMWTHMDAQDASIAGIAMIEDREALERIEEIVQTDGLDAVFIGRGDLTVALRAESISDASVGEAVIRIMSAARSAKKPVCVMDQQAEDIWPLEAQGASAFIVNSDQGMMKRMAISEKAVFERLSPSGNLGTRGAPHHG